MEENPFLLMYIVWENDIELRPAYTVKRSQNESGKTAFPGLTWKRALKVSVEIAETSVPKYVLWKFLMSGLFQILFHTVLVYPDFCMYFCAFSFHFLFLVTFFLVLFILLP